ncbi:aldo/keto reductase [Bacillus spongiae]|uniref:Aldo/keto reductase n=1 Tax=Bacillus spongiae TaxID=2683610 RepID=A0ABU8HHD0_9BACI
MISGYASLNGTKEYVTRFNQFYRTTPMFYTSSIGLGTHLGDMNENDSALYCKGIEYGLRKGLNVIDTAINYRGMKSERDVGYVLTSLIERKLIKREDVVVSTKAGIIAGDIEANLVPIDYLQKVLIEGGIITEADLSIVDHHRHVLAPAYYEFAIHKSKNHLNLETIDIYYVHNPEISMMTLGSEVFYSQLETLFAFFETQVQMGHIKYYGLATWLGLLTNPNEHGYISLEKVVNIAKRLAGNSHHFRFIQFPLNRKINNGVRMKNQKVNHHWVTVVEAAEKLGLFSITSAPFHLGKLIDEGSSSQSMLLEVIQMKGILSTMVGMKRNEHIKENMETIRVFQNRINGKSL